MKIRKRNKRKDEFGIGRCRRVFKRHLDNLSLKIEVNIVKNAVFLGAPTNNYWLISSLNNSAIWDIEHAQN